MGNVWTEVQTYLRDKFNGKRKSECNSNGKGEILRFFASLRMTVWLREN